MNTPSRARLQQALSRNGHGLEKDTETYWLDKFLVAADENEREKIVSLFERVDVHLDKVDKTFVTYVRAQKYPEVGITEAEDQHLKAIDRLRESTDHIVEEVEGSLALLSPLAFRVTNWCRGDLLNLALRTLPLEALYAWSVIRGYDVGVDISPLRRRDDLTYEFVEFLWRKTLLKRDEECWAIALEYLEQETDSGNALKCLLLSEDCLSAADQIYSLDSNRYTHILEQRKHQLLARVREQYRDFSQVPDGWILQAFTPDILKD
jgi:hypothetical protein